jgi:hypothetical protein
MKFRPEQGILTRAATVLAIGAFTVPIAGCEFGGSSDKPKTDGQKLGQLDLHSATVADTVAAFDPQHADPGNVSPNDTLNFQIESRVIKAAKAGEIVDDLEVAYKKNADDLARKQTTGLPAGLKTKTDRAIDAIDADNAVSDYYVDETGATKARQETGDVKDAVIKAQADKTVDVITADNAVSDYYVDETGATKARQKINGIEDEKSKEGALKAIDAVQADKIIEGLDGQEFSAAKARQKAADIKDPELRALTEQAIDSYKPDGYGGGEVSLKLSDTISSKSLNQTEKMDNSASNAVDAMDRQSEKYKIVVEDAANNLASGADPTITTLVRQNNRLKLAGKVELKLPEHKEQSIDLRGVKGGKSIPDALDVLEGKKKLHSLTQFAELHAQGGKLRLKFEEGSNLSPASQTQIGTVVHNLDPLLRAAFANGDLSTVRFIISDDFDPSYIPSIRETYMVLPRDRSTSMDQLSSAVAHETIHALTRAAFADGANVTTQEFTDMTQTCNSLRSVTYNQMETTLSDYPEILTNLSAAAKPQHKKIFDSLAKYVKNGTLDGFLNDQWQSFGDKNLNLTNCLPNTIADLLEYVGDDVGVQDAWNKLEYLKNSPEFQKLATEWVNLQENYSIYNKLNEAAYVKTRYKFKDYLGHTEDNASELVASVADAAISFDGGFTKVISKLPPEQKAAALRAVHVSFELISNRHPSLKNYFKNREAKIVASAK